MLNKLKYAVISTTLASVIAMPASAGDISQDHMSFAFGDIEQATFSSGSFAQLSNAEMQETEGEFIAAAAGAVAGAVLIAVNVGTAIGLPRKEIRQSRREARRERRAARRARR